MRPMRAESTLDRLLRQCYLKPGCATTRSRPTHAPTSQRRHHASHADAAAPSHPPANPQHVHDIAVLGGGITGLASAFYIARGTPKSRVTLYEGTGRLGGWVKTKAHDVGNGQVFFEQGPRTLRPNTTNGALTVDLVRISPTCPTLNGDAPDADGR